VNKLTSVISDKINKTILRTLKTAQIIDLFWDRWIVHGINSEDINKVKPQLKTIEGWVHSWETLAEKKVEQASLCEKSGQIKNAEYSYRQASIYYNLNYWIFPDRSNEKQRWYQQCLEYTYKADSLSEFQIKYDSIKIDGIPCPGRIRIPSKPKGCILIINPIDSSKEELFRYEMEFLENDFATFSFDGPGQGETFALNGLIGSGTRWEIFITKLIDYARKFFPQLPIYLFGTSLGATWVLLGSGHPEVKKSVAVSPAVALNKMSMPHYFEARMQISCDLGPNQRTIPNFSKINYCSPILVFHGNKDMMVTNVQMYELFHQLSTEKKLIEYREEGHCCNYKLDEIRKISIKWFTDDFDY
jgi:hypothetical protein